MNAKGTNTVGYKFERLTFTFSAEYPMDSRTGGCLCKAVRFTVSGPPLRLGLCHCLDCRKTSGSAFVAFGVWPRSAFGGSGQLAEYQGRSFCPQCGSRVASLRSTEAEIMLGSLDDAPNDLAPNYEIWVGRREGWLHALPWADQFEGDRTDEGGNWRQARNV